MKKVIFVDYDDTLCLHKFENKADKYLFADVKTASKHFYDECEPNYLLINYLLENKKNGSKIILISSSSSKLLEVKKYWLMQNCPELIFDDFLATSIDLDKTHTMQAYVEWNKISIDEILFIDDFYTERWAASKIGIETLNPQLVVNRMAKNKD